MVLIMVRYKKQPVVRRNNIFTRKRQRTSDIILQNWHLECHEEGSRLYKLTMVLAIESDFNDLDVTAYSSNDGHLLSRDIGDR